MISSRLKRRYLIASLFKLFCALMTWASVLVLGLLLACLFYKGYRWIDYQFLTSTSSRFPQKAGIYPAIIGTLWLIGFTTIIAVPVGTAAAIYLEEYAIKNWFTRFIDLNISNLAGVPSVVYGILGLALFARYFVLEDSILAGSLTMSLLVLPVIIIASREAIRSVPSSTRQAALALGATRWQTVRDHVLPSAIPGIMTGVILALSRAIGETAPLIMIGIPAAVYFTPDGPMSTFTALPMQIYAWAGEPKQDFHEIAAAGIIILLTVLLVMNTIAVLIRHRSEKATQ